MHKLAIALKEANETMYWLKVLYGSEFISKNQYDELMNNLDEIYKILFSSVKTAKEKLKSSIYNLQSKKAQSSFLDYKSNFFNEYWAFFLYMSFFFCTFAAGIFVFVCAYVCAYA